MWLVVTILPSVGVDTWIWVPAYFSFVALRKWTLGASCCHLYNEINNNHSSCSVSVLCVAGYLRSHISDAGLAWIVICWSGLILVPKSTLLNTQKLCNLVLSHWSLKFCHGKRMFAPCKWANVYSLVPWPTREWMVRHLPAHRWTSVYLHMIEAVSVDQRLLPCPFSSCHLHSCPPILWQSLPHSSFPPWEAASSSPYVHRAWGRPWYHYLLILWLWMGYLASLCLSFLTCKNTPDWISGSTPETNILVYASSLKKK